MDSTISEVTVDSNFLANNNLSSIIFLPENIETTLDAKDFIFPGELATLKKVFHNNLINYEVLGGHGDNLRVRKNADIIIPSMLFGLTLINDNPTIVSLALNVISNYLTDLFKGKLGQKTVSVEFYVELEEAGKLKKIGYKGDVNGLKELEPIIKSLKK